MQYHCHVMWWLLMLLIMLCEIYHMQFFFRRRMLCGDGWKNFNLHGCQKCNHWLKGQKTYQESRQNSRVKFSRSNRFEIIQNWLGSRSRSTSEDQAFPTEMQTPIWWTIQGKNQEAEMKICPSMDWRLQYILVQHEDLELWRTKQTWQMDATWRACETQGQTHT